jgi:hypothetical protein
MMERVAPIHLASFLAGIDHGMELTATDENSPMNLLELAALAHRLGPSFEDVRLADVISERARVRRDLRA